MLELARHAGLRTVATNNVHYATTGEGNLRDLLVVGRSIAESALSEPKSVGAHYLEDVPVMN